MVSRETLGVLAARRSTRAFAPTPLEEDTLRAVAEAGSLAPYAMADARRLIVITNAPLLERINAAAKAQACRTDLPHLRQLGENPDFHCLYHAPVLALATAGAASPAPMEDCSAAAQNMLIAAEALDLGACWVFFPLLAFESPEGDALRAAVRMDAGYAPYAAVVLGRRAADAMPPREPGGIRYVR